METKLRDKLKSSKILSLSFEIEDKFVLSMNDKILCVDNLED